MKTYLRKGGRVGVVDSQALDTQKVFAVGNADREVKSVGNCYVHGYNSSSSTICVGVSLRDMGQLEEPPVKVGPDIAN